MFNKKTNKIKKLRLKTDSYRVQAQVLFLPTTRLLWLNSYMPVDPQTISYGSDELNIVLAEVERIIDTAEFDDIIWMADFNWDKIRNTGFTNVMNNFVKKLELHDAWDTFPVDYTHIHTDLKSMSTIDRILVNKRLIGCLVDAGALHLGDNLSRHSPIMVKLDLGSIPKNVQSNNRTIRRPAWDKAEVEDIDTYTSELDLKLRNLVIPDSLFCLDPHCKNLKHNSEKDSYMMDILSEIIETAYDTIPLSGRGGRKWNPEKNCPIGKVVPRWKEVVEPFRQDSMFWHSVWISADKPKMGELHSLMCRTRN